MRQRIFLLMDACQFYISCERVFGAALHKKPSIVLSNNDGNIVALSPEARALGLRRGQPFFQCQEIIREHGVLTYSSNYSLYGHMSANMMAVLREYCPRVEVYSIDEAFALITNLPIDDLTEFGQTLRQRIYQYTGLPVRIAIAPSKGLTKIGCELLKANPQYEDVLDLTAFTAQQLEQALTQVEIENVWGIGRKYARYLHNYGIVTARDLRDADERWIRKQLTVVGARIQLELKGISCLPLEEKPPPGAR